MRQVIKIIKKLAPAFYPRQVILLLPCTNDSVANVALRRQIFPLKIGSSFFLLYFSLDSIIPFIFLRNTLIFGESIDFSFHGYCSASTTSSFTVD